MFKHINKTLYVGAIVMLLSASVFVACQSKQEKITEETKEAIDDIKTTPVSDWQPFKAATEKSIANNEDQIKSLKEKIKKSNTPNLDKLRQTRINALEDRNTALRAKIMEYKEDDVKTSLAQFKEDVQKQLDDMEKDLKELDK